jgi:hypothetical protein
MKTKKIGGAEANENNEQRALKCGRADPGPDSGADPEADECGAERERRIGGPERRSPALCRRSATRAWPG